MQEVEFGTISIDNNSYMLRWRVLQETGNQMLIHCMNGIAVMAYDLEGHTVNWEKSKIRSWLNCDFVELSFSSEEKEKILDSRLDNFSELMESSPKISYTNDKVFLLSEDEIERLGLEKEEWIREPLDAIKNQTNGAWWLRSYGRLEGKSMSLVRPDGVVYPSGDIRADDIMVVPAVWVRK